MVVDVGPVNVRGAISGNRVRVVYQDGTLYVVHSAGRINHYPADEPTESNGTWRTAVPAGDISFTRRGCSSCGWRLGAIPLADILAVNA